MIFKYYKKEINIRIKIYQYLCNWFFINNKKILKEDIKIKLNEITKQDIVSIQADKLTPYEEFVFIVDLLKQKGIEKISMVVQNEG